LIGHVQGTSPVKHWLFQEREHWKLESQLLQMKHDKLRDQSQISNEDGDEMDEKKVFIQKLDNLVTISFMKFM
jgi:hypothetical protein